MTQGYTLDRAEQALEFAGLKGAVMGAILCNPHRRVSVLALSVEALEAHYGIEPRGPVGMRLTVIEEFQEAIHEW